MALPTYLRMQEITGRLGLARSTVYKLIQAGEFPPPIKLTRRTSAWREADIEAFLSARESRSRATATGDTAGAP